MIRFLAPALVMFPLLSGVLAEAAPVGIPESHAPLTNQTEGGAFVKVAEGCGTGYFRDGYGHCRYYGYGAPPAPPDEACRPDGHFVHWANHRGGFCKLYYDTGVREWPPQRSAVEATSVARGATERVFELPLSSGERQRVLYLALRSPPRATIVMLPGGAGNIELTRDGDVRRGDNFVVRTREMWAANGYAVVIPDTIDHANLRGVRSSSEYASVVEALIRFAHAQAPGPVFLVGTSQGSIAAANGAAHAHPGTLAGVVLTESVSRLGGSHETVFDADLQDIRIAALVVANRDDRCNVAPPQDAPKIAAAISHSPDVRVMKVSGGIDASSNTCASLTPHGYYGIEAQVVEAISDWIRDRLH